MRQLNAGGTDLFHTSFRVYIEGVEVPFINGNVSSSFNGLPQATINIPPYRGLTDLGKGYFPKIHVFYRDLALSTTPYEQLLNGSYENDLEDNRHAWKQLFEGVIRNIQDVKNTGGLGYSMLSLDCVHPSYVLDDIRLDIISQNPVASNSTSVTGAVAVASVSSTELLMQALTGVYLSEGDELEKGGSDPAVASEDWKPNLHRLGGMPGTIASLWNCIKLRAYASLSPGEGGNYITGCHPIKDMYAPLLEQGLKVFNKMAGHSLIEQGTTFTNVPMEDPSKGTSEESAPPRPIAVPLTMQQYVRQGVAKVLSLAVEQAMSQNASSGMESQTREMATYGGIVKSFLNFIKYDMVTMNSPVSIANAIGGSNRENLEYIVKPTLPFYYAPICNVILPNLLDSFSITFQNDAVPSRISLKASIAMDGFGSFGIFNNVNYTAPHSIRKVSFKGGELNNGSGKISNTLHSYVVNVGDTEWGSGIRYSEVNAPYWYNLLVNDDAAHSTASIDIATGLKEHAANLTKAADSWDKIFGTDNKPFNPWRIGDVTGLKPYQTVNFISADTEFVRNIANTRVGNVSCLFNPYIIAGYPMDVIDPSPERESYHGLCTSVSHSFDSSGSATTTIGMASILTYSELVSCYLPVTEPWQVTTLGFEDNLSLYANKAAYEKACAFYADVLGVGAADPTLLENYSLGVPRPVTRQLGVWKVGTTTDSGMSMYETVLGNLMLVARNIKSLPEVEAEYFPGDETFIDIEFWNEGTPTTAKQAKWGWLEDTKVQSATNVAKSHNVEQSPYLDYNLRGESKEFYEYPKVIDPTKRAPIKQTVPTSGEILSGTAGATHSNEYIPDPNQGSGAVCGFDGIFDSSSWAKLQTCDPKLIQVFIAVHKEMPCIITDGYRTFEQQASASANSGYGNGQRSKHRIYPSKAVDAVPCTHRTGGSRANSPRRTAFAQLVIQKGRELGVTVKWGASFNDYVHFYID